MRLLQFLGLAVLSGALVLMGSAPAQAGVNFGSGDSVFQSEPVTSDGFFVGESVTIDANVAGELFAAGNDVSVMQPGRRSVWLAGNNVYANGAAWNLFAAGNTVTVKGEYGNNLYIAASTIIIEKEAVINGDVHAAGSKLIIRGTIKGDLIQESGNTIFNAEVGGTVRGNVHNLVIEGGKISGDLSYTSSIAALGLEKVTVSGKTERLEPKVTNLPKGPMALAGLINMLLLGGLLLLIGQRRLGVLVDRVQQNWGQQIVTGFAILFLTPMLIFTLMVILIGMKVALVAVLSYLTLIMVAGVPAHLLAARQLSIWLKWPFLQSPYNGFLVVAVLLSLMTFVPLLGDLLLAIYFVAFWLPSFGVLAMSLVERREKKQA